MLQRKEIRATWRHNNLSLSLKYPLPEKRVPGPRKGPSFRCGRNKKFGERSNRIPQRTRHRRSLRMDRPPSLPPVTLPPIAFSLAFPPNLA